LNGETELIREIVIRVKLSQININLSLPLVYERHIGTASPG
jgi:hypothetical protein